LRKLRKNKELMLKEIKKENKNTPDNPICEKCGEPVAYYIENSICAECAGELREN
jgi:ribosomal protein L37E